MGVIINCFEFLNGIVRVDLRRGQGRVTQEFLYGVQVGSVVQQSGCQGVPEYVGGLPSRYRRYAS